MVRAPGKDRGKRRAETVSLGDSVVLTPVVGLREVAEKAGLCLGEQRQPGARGEEPEGGHL